MYSFGAVWGYTEMNRLPGCAAGAGEGWRWRVGEALGTVCRHRGLGAEAGGEASLHPHIPAPPYPRLPVSSHPCVPTTLHPCILSSLQHSVLTSFDPSRPFVLASSHPCIPSPPYPIITSSIHPHIPSSHISTSPLSSPHPSSLYPGAQWWRLAEFGEASLGWGQHPCDAGESICCVKLELWAIYSFFCVIFAAAGICGLIRVTNNDETCDLSESLGYNYVGHQVKESLLD